MYLRMLIAILLISSCSSKDKETTPTPPKVLDTSFLKLGKVGTKEVTGNFVVKSHIHVLNSNQDITLVNSSGLIKIDNFDYQTLDDGDVIVGNEKDQYLFKYDKSSNPIQNNEIKVKPATLSDLDQNASIKVDFTPELNYQAPEGRTFSKVNKDPISTPANNDIIIGPITDGDDPGQSINPDQKNVLVFKDYEIIDTSKLNIASYNRLLNNKASLEKGEGLKVTIDEGKVEIIPTFTGNYNLMGMNNMELSATFNSYLKYRFKITVTTTKETKGDISFPLFKELSFPIRAMAGAVPIYADLMIEFPAGIKIESKNKGSITFVVENQYALTASADYDSSTGDSYDGHYDYVIKDQKLSVEKAGGDYSFEVYFEPKIKTKLYKVFGPYAYINTSVQTDVKIPLESSKDDLFLNFTGGIGFVLEDPIFGEEAFKLQSDSLYNFTKGWDIIGPQNGDAVSTRNKVASEMELQVNELNNKNQVPIQLRPRNAGPLTKIIIKQNPNFGQLVLGDNFAVDGIAYYTPPNIIEGKDSFQIQIVDRGYTNAPTRISLNLSQKAKNQAKNDPINVLPNYSGKSSSSISPVIVGDLIVVEHKPEDFDEKLITKVPMPPKGEVYKKYLLSTHLAFYAERSSEEERPTQKTVDFYDVYLVQTLQNKLYLKLMVTKDYYEYTQNHGFNYINHIDKEIFFINKDLQDGFYSKGTQGSQFFSEIVESVLPNFYQFSYMQSNYNYDLFNKIQKTRRNQSKVYFNTECLRTTKKITKALEEKIQMKRMTEKWRFQLKSLESAIKDCKLQKVELIKA